MIRFLLLFVLTFNLHAQSSQNIDDTSASPEITDNRLADIPVAQDDSDSQIVLTQMIRKAEWLANVKIKVDHGVVYITGNYKNKDHMNWLIQTAEKLPTVLAVVNNAKLVTPPVTDLAPYTREWTKLLQSVKKNMPKILVGLALSIFFLTLGIYLQKGFHHLWKRRIKNPFLLSTVTKLAFIPVWALFFYIVLQILGMQSLATTIIGGTGVAGIVFGLAFRGIAENYLSGFLLAMRSPFTQGDHIKVNDYQGLVQNLNMRGTTIMDFDGNLILIPNTTVIQSVVQNYSANPHKRTYFEINVGQHESFGQIQALILQVLRDIKGIKDEPVPMVVVDTLGPTSVMKIKVYFWFDASECSDINLKSYAMARIKDTLLSEGITVSGTELKEEIMKRALQNLSSEGTDGNGVKHEQELQKIAETTSLPVNNRSANLLKH